MKILEIYFNVKPPIILIAALIIIIVNNYINLMNKFIHNFEY